MDRRTFVKASSLGVLLSQSSLLAATSLSSEANPVVFPKRLKQGDTIVLVAPAGALSQKVELDIAVESFQAMGLNVTVGKHVLDRDGYFAGKDQDRASDINDAFATPQVKGIFAIRGGWGCNRILPFLDFDLIAKNPKVLMGYSDITTLLNSIYQRTGLVSFHGPVGVSYWGQDQAQQLRRMIFDGGEFTIKNQADKDQKALTQRRNRIQVINSGVATGRLIGGNLTVLTSMVGTPYLPDMQDKILFLEDVDESIYRIDRYLSTLQLAGKLEQLAGVAFGQCSDCDPEKGYGGFTLLQILEHYFKPLGIPTYMGGQFGHVRDNNILPVGVKVELNADQGSLRLLESPVS
ncbi:S66 peptidase family protein [Paraglaciecola arctica]|uniref:S66 peptidase family protein n=1 Tax=Paraglaciecola arctica TaxID=1128911 RepID=UPI001C06590A|nr:LD-carboxypeptidase [Paraglaciecola arctica]MBU3001742.1 LD-carboxypeptidase [Paraglaciecola arctica]